MARFYQPLQRKTDGRWDYTVGSDDEGWTHPLGYCTGPWKPMVAGDAHGAITDQMAVQYNARTEPFKDKYHADGHATSEEAVACYRDFELDQELRFHEDQTHPDELHRCEAESCDAFTSGLAELGEFRHWYLCAIHRNRETVESLLAAGIR